MAIDGLLADMSEEARHLRGITDGQPVTAETLAAWLNDPRAILALQEANALLGALMPGATLVGPDTVPGALLLEVRQETEGVTVQVGDGPDCRPIAATITAGPSYRDPMTAHALWEASEPQPDHFLWPLVAAWVSRPTPAKPFVPVRRASLPALSKPLRPDDTTALANPVPMLVDGATEASLPTFALPRALKRLAYLVEPDTGITPSWLLNAFDAAGGASMRRGRGAPVELRLFITTLLCLGVKQRNGALYEIAFPHLIAHEKDWADDTPSIERLLWGGEGWKARWRDWDNLPDALRLIRDKLGWVHFKGLGQVVALTPSVIPKSKEDKGVAFIARTPSSAAQGARIDWRKLQQYGLHSARLYRAYLASTAFLDRSANAGHPITAEIAAPLRGKNGRPVRRKGGVVVRSPTDTEANWLTRFAKPLGDDDLTRMIGFDPNARGATGRSHRHRTVEAFETLHEDGVIDLREEEQGRWRILGVSQRNPTH